MDSTRVAMLRTGSRARRAVGSSPRPGGVLSSHDRARISARRDIPMYWFGVNGTVLVERPLAAGDLHDREDPALGRPHALHLEWQVMDLHLHEADDALLAGVYGRVPRASDNRCRAHESLEQLDVNRGARAYDVVLELG